MDSPVIVDSASKFGRGIDLDGSFPGFPFDDDGFGRRSDIRAHLDDLASRHPEFADHLLGPPWGDIPFHGTLRNRRRGSGSGGPGYQGHPDEDARSQASGSSAASAASGASGVSSHGEPDASHNPQDRPDYDPEVRRNPIPQYGLRNTVDIGQHRHNMENADKGNRGQRSMSAPPENRQSNQPPQDQGQQAQGQRFVSRVDITPQHNQPQQQPQKPAQQQQPQQQPQKPQQQGNVRHIPIFVEGRDEPVIPKNVDESHFRREPSPPQFHTPPHFHRSSPFGQHFSGRQQPQWPPHFQDPFYREAAQGAYEQPTGRRQQPQAYYQQPKQQYAEKQRHEPQQQQQQQPKQQQQQRTQPPPPPQQQQQQPPQQQEPPKPKPAPPKDPLERVALVQKEVDSLAEQVKQYGGNSRKDKEYIYLDEMLTRELIKLDDIETEGRDNVRQARKNAIKSIQDTISLLESKAPLPSQQRSHEGQDVQESQNDSNAQEEARNEPMDVDQKQEEQVQSREPIPLPPGPSSPMKKSAESNDVPDVETQEQTNPAVDQATTEEQIEQKQEEVPSTQTSGEPMDTAPAEKLENTVSVDEQRSTENVDSEQAPVANETVEASEEKKPDETSQEKKPEDATESQQNKDEKMDVDSQATKSPRAPKKGKKSKKQTPVSEQAIPLPAPESAETNAK